MNLNFEVVFFLPIYARKYAKHNERLVGRQTIKYWHNRQITRDIFLDNAYEANCVNISHNFALYFTLDFLASTGSTSHLLSFVSIS